MLYTLHSVIEADLKLHWFLSAYPFLNNLQVSFLIPPLECWHSSDISLRLSTVHIRIVTSRAFGFVTSYVWLSTVCVVQAHLAQGPNRLIWWRILLCRTRLDSIWNTRILLWLLARLRLGGGKQGPQGAKFKKALRIMNLLPLHLHDPENKCWPWPLRWA